MKYTPRKRRTIAERFLSFTDRESSPHGCWLWTGSKYKGKWPYGRFGIDYKIVEAHRVSWILWSGRELNPGEFVCHNCPGGDNPSCVNPEHLFVSTNRGNREDSVKKGTHSHGERVPCSILTEEQVLEIRRLYFPKRTLKAICEAEGLDYNSVQGYLRPERRDRKSPIPPEQLERIRLEHRAERPLAEDLAKRFQVDSVTIMNVVNRRTWKHLP